MPHRRSLGSVCARKDGSWLVRVSMGRDARTGRRMTASKVVRGSRREAEEELARMLARAGELPERACRMTVREMVEGVWLPACEARLRRDTVQGYRSAMDAHVLPAIGPVPLEELRPSQVDAMLARIPTPGARRKAYSVLRAALRFAVRKRLVQRAATDAVDPPAPGPYEPQVLDAAQAAAYLAAFRGSPVEPGVLVALGCGLRRSEACALDWEDVDLVAREVDVRRRYLVVDGEPDMGEAKTRNSRRVVSLPRSFADRLAEVRPPMEGEGPHPLMPSPRGGRLPPDTFTHMYRRAVEAAGLPYVPLKNLRHTHATLMLAAGVDVVTVSRRLGHASVSTTDRFYLRPRRAADERAADAFDRAGLL